jgi:hypothetical protein
MLRRRSVAFVGASGGDPPKTVFKAGLLAVYSCGIINAVTDSGAYFVFTKTEQVLS